MIISIPDLFPIGRYRPLTRIEQGCLRLMVLGGAFMHGGKLSVEKATKYVYGSPCPKRREEIRKAIRISRTPALQTLV